MTDRVSECLIGPNKIPANRDHDILIDGRLPAAAVRRSDL